MPGIAEAGVAGVVVLLVLKEVFAFIGKKAGVAKDGECAGLLKKIQDLWYWHAPDHDGEQGWKGKNLERIMVALDMTMKENTRTVSEGNAKVVAKLEELRTEIKNGHGSTGR